MLINFEVDFSRLPSHIGIIPDGNRRWAEARGRPNGDGYATGIEPGFALLDACQELEIEEVSIYGFTKANVRRPLEQIEAFREACPEIGLRLDEEGTALRVVGDAASKAFPDRLKSFAKERSEGDLCVNLLVNYGWQWDLRHAIKQCARKQHVSRDPSNQETPLREPPIQENGSAEETAAPLSSLASSGVSRVDLVIRWGGHRRLSGFLPAQCAYADIYVVDTLWPDMQV